MHEGEIAERAAVLRLPIKDLAALAGLNKHTAYGAASEKRDVRSSTRDRLLRALEAEERRVLAILQQRHGSQGGQHDAAA